MGGRSWYWLVQNDDILQASRWDNALTAKYGYFQSNQHVACLARRTCLWVDVVCCKSFLFCVVTTLDFRAKSLYNKLSLIYSFPYLWKLRIDNRCRYAEYCRQLITKERTCQTKVNPRRQPTPILNARTSPYAQRSPTAWKRSKTYYAVFCVTPSTNWK